MRQRRFPISDTLRCFLRILKALGLERSFFAAVQLAFSEFRRSLPECAKVENCIAQIQSSLLIGQYLAEQRRACLRQVARES